MKKAKIGIDWQACPCSHFEQFGLFRRCIRCGFLSREGPVTSLQRAVLAIQAGTVYNGSRAALGLSEAEFLTLLEMLE